MSKEAVTSPFRGLRAQGWSSASSILKWALGLSAAGLNSLAVTVLSALNDGDDLMAGGLSSGLGLALVIGKRNRLSFQWTSDGCGQTWRRG